MRTKTAPTYAILTLAYLEWFGFFVFNGISTLFRLFNAKAILLEEPLWNYLTHSWENKGVHTFPKDICPKVNVIARLEYELAYYDSAVHHFNHYTTRTPPIFRRKSIWNHRQKCNKIITEFIRSWKRYLDDCFLFWKCQWDNINNLYNLLQNLHPKMKFTMEYSFKELPFVDILIKNGQIITDINHNPTDIKQYLHFKSPPLQNYIKSIPNSR